MDGEIKNTQEKKRIIIIPSISDPRNTVASIASFQSDNDIQPPIPIVVIYGTCPNRARNQGEEKEEREEGKEYIKKYIDGWYYPWDKKTIADIKNRFSDLSNQHNVPIYFFDDVAQENLWRALDTLADEARLSSHKLPFENDPGQFKECVEGIFSAIYSYGAQRNKGFIIANYFSADYVFFFDDDTYIFPEIEGENIFGAYTKLLDDNDKVHAVTGGYLCQPAFNAMIFKGRTQQDEFRDLLKDAIPDDKIDLKDPSKIYETKSGHEGVLGGNFCIKKEVYRKLCLPNMHRTPTTDDRLLGREIAKEFRSGSVIKTGWPVIHIHFPQRMESNQVTEYLESWAKTKAFWEHYNGGVSNEKKMKPLIESFAGRLSGLVPKESSGEITKAIKDAAEEVRKNAEGIAKRVLKDIHDYELLKDCWSAILEETKSQKDIWDLPNHWGI